MCAYTSWTRIYIYIYICMYVCMYVCANTASRNHGIVTVPLFARLGVKHGWSWVIFGQFRIYVQFLGSVKSVHDDNVAEFSRFKWWWQVSFKLQVMKDWMQCRHLKIFVTCEMSSFAIQHVSFSPCFSVILPHGVLWDARHQLWSKVGLLSQPVVLASALVVVPLAGTLQPHVWLTNLWAADLKTQIDR